MSPIITAHPVEFYLNSHGIMLLIIAVQAMLTLVALLFILPTLVSSSGEGNIHLLEDEVATALRSCTHYESLESKGYRENTRKRRSDDNNFQTSYGNEVPRIDDRSKQENMNLYGHERRNSSDQYIYVLNGTEKPIPSFDRVNTSVKYVTTATIPYDRAYSNNTSNLTRSKRSDSLMNNSKKDECLSQCVFANLQVVDERGIPRETELWNKVQTGVMSQQSRTLLNDQIRSCFQELQSDSEAEEDGCSYSNKLERCLMLRFSDRSLVKLKPD